MTAIATLSRTVMDANGLGIWYVRATPVWATRCGARPAILRPSIAMVPRGRRAARRRAGSPAWSCRSRSDRPGRRSRPRGPRPRRASSARTPPKSRVDAAHRDQHSPGRTPAAARQWPVVHRPGGADRATVIGRGRGRTPVDQRWPPTAAASMRVQHGVQIGVLVGEHHADATTTANEAERRATGRARSRPYRPSGADHDQHGQQRAQDDVAPLVQALRRRAGPAAPPGTRPR